MKSSLGVFMDDKDCYHSLLKLLGDVVAPLIERQTHDPKTPDSNPVCFRSTRKNCEFFRVKNVVLSGVPYPRVYTHA